MKKFLNYYHNIPIPVKASFWFLACSVLQKGFAIISTPVFTRILTTDQYGQVANYNSWYNLLFYFVTFGITGVAYNNILVKHENDREQATLSVMTLTILITLSFFVIYFWGKTYWNDILGISTPIMCVMFLQFISAPMFDFWSAKERYDYKYKKLVIISLSNTIINLCVGVILVLCVAHKYEARVIVAALSSFMIGSALYIITWRRAKFEFTTKYWKYAITISLPLIPHSLSIRILNQCDRVMITKMVGSSATAIYSLAYTVAMLMTMLTEAINRSLCPFIYKGIKNNEIKPIRKMVDYVVLIVMIATVFGMLIAPEIINAFATKEYYDAIWIIPPVALSVYFTFLYVIFSNVEFYYEKTIFATIVSVLAAAINIVLNYIFIDIYGYRAAGYTTLVCYILFSLFHYINFQRVIKAHYELKDIYNISHIFLISVSGIGMMFLCIVLYSHYFLRWILILLIMLCAITKRKDILKCLMTEFKK